MMNVVFMKYMDLQIRHPKPSSVIYLQYVLGNSNSTTLLCSKSRLVPSKLTTIPRLELSACVLLFEHVKSAILALSKQISIRKVYCWSDLLIALWWIKPGNYGFRIESRKFVKMLILNIGTM